MIDLGGKTPRDYQIRCVEECRRQVKRGKRWIIINSPTGSGKTFIGCMLIKLAAERGKKALFIAPRRELVRQTAEHLVDCGVRHSIIAAGFNEMRGADCYVASKDTLAARTIRSKRIELPQTDLLIVDECHLSRAKEAMKLLAKIEKENPDLVALGLSATPGRADGKGLGDRWDCIVTAAGYEELQAAGFLVPVRLFNAKHILDMRGVNQEDWDKEAAKRVDKVQLVGDVVDHWKRLAAGLPTIVFGATVAHSMHLRDEFRKQGILAEHLDMHTPSDERDQILADLRDDTLQVVCNCDILSIGYDDPHVACVVLAAPTRSLVKYRQRAGRALRPSPGKEHCIILDHSGASVLHGIFPDEDIEWPLEASRNIDKEYQKKRAEGGTKEPLVCQNCGCTYTGRADCPNCGHRQRRKARDIAIAKGLLREVKKKKKRINGHRSLEDKIQFWHKCLAIMAHKGRTVSAAAVMYSKHCGEPPWNTRGLPNVPEPGKKHWRVPVSEAYPQYVRRKR